MPITQVMRSHSHVKAYERNHNIPIVDDYDNEFDNIAFQQNVTNCYISRRSFVINALFMLLVISQRCTAHSERPIMASCVLVCMCTTYNMIYGFIRVLV